MKDSRIKILHVTFNMGIGGTEQVIRQIIENSDAEKFAHEILCIDGEIGPLGCALEEKGIHVECTQRQAGTDFKLIRFIRRLIKSRDVDVLHCHQYTPYFYGVLGAAGKRVKVIFTEHGRFYPDRHHFKRRFINPLLVMMTRYITAISKSTADAMAEYEYVPRDRIEVIYNGIRDLQAEAQDRSTLLKALGLDAQYRYIGTISRLEPIKNQAMMIKAFQQSKLKVPELKLVLIGDGAIKSELMALAKSLGVEQDVIFTGFIDNPQRFLGLFEIFLLSSFSEGTSMTLLEAMSLSRPCVATSVGGNPEIVADDGTGRLVASDNAALFSEAITVLLLDKDLRATYGAAGRARFLQAFTAEHMIECYHTLYKGTK